MPNLMDRGMNAMNRLLGVGAAITGVYTRRASAGGGSTMLVDFIAGNSDWVSQPAPGEARLRMDFQTRTIIGPTASLVIDPTEGPFEPDVGDTWTEIINGETIIFKVMP